MIIQGGGCHLRKRGDVIELFHHQQTWRAWSSFWPHFCLSVLNPGFFFFYPMIKSLLLALNTFNQGGSKGFGLRRQNLSHDTTCLGIMVIFLPLCTEGAPSLSVSLLVPFVMRWPLFFVREMRGQAHHWELDPPRCLPEMFWSFCTDVWKQRRWLLR